jgi:hypothetical protein
VRLFNRQWEFCGKLKADGDRRVGQSFMSELLAPTGCVAAAISGGPYLTLFGSGAELTVTRLDTLSSSGKLSFVNIQNAARSDFAAHRLHSTGNHVVWTTGRDVRFGQLTTTSKIVIEANNSMPELVCCATTKTRVFVCDNTRVATLSYDGHLKGTASLPSPAITAVVAAEMLVVACNNGWAQFTTADEPQLLRTVEAPFPMITVIELFSVGTAVCARHESTITVLDDKLDVLREMCSERPSRCCAATDDHLYVAVGAEVLRSDPTSGRVVSLPLQGLKTVEHLVVSKQHGVIIAASDNSAAIFNLSGGRPLRTFALHGENTSSICLVEAKRVLLEADHAGRTFAYNVAAEVEQCAVRQRRSASPSRQRDQERLLRRFTELEAVMSRRPLAASPGNVRSSTSGVLFSSVTAAAANQWIDTSIGVELPAVHSGPSVKATPTVDKFSSGKRPLLVSPLEQSELMFHAAAASPPPLPPVEASLHVTESVAAIALRQERDATVDSDEDSVRVSNGSNASSARQLDRPLSTEPPPICSTPERPTRAAHVDPQGPVDEMLRATTSVSSLRDQLRNAAERLTASDRERLALNLSDMASALHSSPSASIASSATLDTIMREMHEMRDENRRLQGQNGEILLLLQSMKK